MGRRGSWLETSTNGLEVIWGEVFHCLLGGRKPGSISTKLRRVLGRVRAKKLRATCGQVSAETSSSVIRLRFLRGVLGRSVDLGPEVVNRDGRSETSRRGRPAP
jgi:hypothetical protein